MIRFFAAALVSALPLGALAAPFSEAYPELFESLPEDLQAAVAPIDFQTGEITLPGGKAKLTVPENYHFLDAQDSKLVLEDLWGNPPGAPTLGMIFPAELTPLHDNAWGIEITFDDIGYVSDEDAGTYDYTELLDTMRSDLSTENKWRAENGFSTIELVGWASEPHYDQAERKLHWAKELHFADTEGNTLNYNIRALGRHGVLVLNFIASMESLPEIEAALPDVLGMVSFTEGNRYADFQPGVDKVAAVGIGGLIAGKVLAKTGFLAVALVFLKKAWFILLLPLIWLKNLFTRSKEE